jgi:membrane protein YqaA with SNARE-associated domain
MLTKMYDKMLSWARDPRAVRYLAMISFAESSFFPIPPDVMLAPMSMARPKNAYYYAFITTVSSVCGGILGYLIGYMLYEPVVIPLFNYLGLIDKLPVVERLFNSYGGLAILIAGFATPIPFKLITISTGAFGVNFYLFVLLSCISRGMRFFLVSLAMCFGGEKMERWFRKNINIVILSALSTFAIGYLVIS